MGLSGRKEKQRIPNDPRNLSWADDASRFGSSYLSKFGWDSSKGLGATGEGMTSHIKVSQKLDMMGIGAAHQKDPNGTAWKQNRDFENLLRRLNATSGTTETTLDVEMKEEFVAETTVQVKEEARDDDDRRKREKRDKKEKKRKEKEGREEGKEKKKEKKRKREDEERSEKQKRRKSSEEPSSEKELKEELSPAPASAPAKQPAPPRYRAHRARAIAAKSISHKSSVHISEILGIAPSASTSETTSAIGSGSATPAGQGKLTVISELEKLTTSTKSVADYFKEKLQLKSLKASSTTSTPADSSESSTPAVGLGMSRRTSDYEEDKPAGGLGFRSGGLGFGGGGLGFSKVRLEVKEECNVVEEATMRMGLSKFSSLTSSKFLASETLSFDKESAIPVASESKIEEAIKDAGSSSSEEEESREERKSRRRAEKKAEAGGKEKKERKERNDKREERGKKQGDSAEKRERKQRKQREKEKKSKKAEEA